MFHFNSCFLGGLTLSERSFLCAHHKFKTLSFPRSNEFVNSKKNSIAPRMGRSPCCSKEGVNRGAWTPEEDRILTQYISTNGIRDWRNLPKNAGLNRCGKSCRLRWLNYLRPDIKRGNISEEEEELVIRLHKLLGNRWSLIAGRLPGRTDNEIKNYWNTRLRKKYEKNTHTDSPQTCKNRKPKIKKEPEFVKTVPVKTIAIRPKVKREEQESAGLEKKVDVPMSLSWEELFMMSENDDNGNVVARICDEEDAFDDLFEFAYPSNSLSSSSSQSPPLMEGNGEDNLKEWGTMDNLQPLSLPLVSSP